MGKGLGMRKINTDREKEEPNILKNWTWPMYVMNAMSSNSMYVLMRRKKQKDYINEKTTMIKIISLR